MTCQQSTGGAGAAYVVHIIERSAIQPAAGPMPLVLEAAAVAYDELQELVSRADAGRATWPIGKLMARRPAPRRLDARIVTRRPMMLVKRRQGRVPFVGRISGREIIARS